MNGFFPIHKGQSMNHINVSVLEFIEKFPEFAQNEYTDVMFCRAQAYISNLNCGLLQDCSRKLAIYLLMAHLLTIQNAISSGDTSGLIQASASIDKISVSNVPPPVDESNYWFFLTPYGQQLWMLFDFHFATPGYIGGSFVRVLR